MKKKCTIIICVSSFILGFVLCWLFFVSDGTGKGKAKIKWKIMGSELEIDLKKDMVSHDVLLEKMFSKNFSKAGTIDWLIRNKNIFPLYDSKLTDAIDTLPFENKISFKMRKISDKRHGPWNYPVDIVSIGIPSEEDRPRIRKANVCAYGKYQNKDIIVYNPKNGKEILVSATGTYRCLPLKTYPDLQLSLEDALELFGNRPLNKYEKACAIILH